MTLRKWRTNSVDFRKIVPLELTETADLMLTSPLEALGICWDVAHDTFHISVPDMEEGIVTKVTAKIYDILGLLAPAIIPAKLILQNLWRLKVGWDDEVLEDIKVRWTTWIRSDGQHGYQNSSTWLIIP